MGTAKLTIEAITVMCLLTSAVIAAKMQGNLNAKPFAVLCNVLNALTTIPDVIDNNQLVRESALDIGSLNISASAPGFRDKVNTKKNFSTLEKAEKHDNDNELATWNVYYDFWKDSESKLEARNQRGDQINLSNLTSAAKLKLRHFTELAFRSQSDERLEKPTAKKAEFETAAVTAIYGAAGKDGKPNADGTDRPAQCGTTSKTKGTASGQTLREDFLCLCAKQGAGTTDKVCCPGCTTANPTHWATKDDSKKIFETLLKECTERSTLTQTSSAAIASAIAKFQQEIATTQGTGQEALYTLGQIEGNAGTGCGGTSNANGGLCVIYTNSAAADEAKPDVAWLKPAKKAQNALAELQAANTKAESFLSELIALNNTVHAITDTVTSGITTEIASAQKTIISEEEKCNKIDKATDCTVNPKCKWDDEAKDEAKKCTLSEEGKKEVQQAAEKAGEPQTGCAKHGTDKAKCETDKTDGKHSCVFGKSKDNEDDKDTEKCRNDSFLVNKKLALMASSFVIFESILRNFD
uniref:Variant surface glycoprotein 1125.148 n=1 Tax=Trypanosoma brucei TaxID=5691 RepID=A0A1J0R470_9TRYP|nr:variant surface glycoprotein 1125.148 [Trypanosoma brucei]